MVCISCRDVTFSFLSACLQILRNAVSKTYNRICDLRKEISSLKKGVVLAEEVASKSKAELEAAEAKLSLVNGEPVLGENPLRMKRLKSHAEKTKEEEISVRDSLEAKEALLARAIDEIEVYVHLVFLYSRGTSLIVLTGWYNGFICEGYLSCSGRSFGSSHKHPQMGYSLSNTRRARISERTIFPKYKLFPLVAPTIFLAIVDSF